MSWHLKKLCYLAGESEWSVFHIAGEGIPEYMIERDFKNYLMNERLPEYVVEFVEQGKEIIEGAEVSPFTFWCYI